MRFLKNNHKVNLGGIVVFIFFDIIYQYPLTLVFAYFFNRRVFSFTDFLYSHASWTLPLLMTMVLLGIVLVAWRFGFLKGTLKNWSVRRVLILIGVIGFTLIINYLVTILVIKTQVIPSVGEDFMMTDVLGQLPVAVQKYILGFIVPLTEELLFRSFIFGSIENKRVAFFVSWLGFALVHTGFSLAIVPYLVLSFIITWAYSRNMNVLESAAVHASINIWGLTMIKLFDSIFKVLPY